MAFTSRSSTRIVCAFMLSEALMFGVGCVSSGLGLLVFGKIPVGPAQSASVRNAIYGLTALWIGGAVLAIYLFQHYGGEWSLG